MICAYRRAGVMRGNCLELGIRVGPTLMGTWPLGPNFIRTNGWSVKSNPR